MGDDKFKSGMRVRNTKRNLVGTVHLQHDAEIVWVKYDGGPMMTVRTADLEAQPPTASPSPPEPG